jgi:hypothetical protein
LDFELLVWIADPPETEPIKSALYFLITAELCRRQIEIPFPQRDLRLQATPALTSLIQKFQGQPVQGHTISEQDILPQDTVNSCIINLEKGTIPIARSLPTLRDMLRRVSYFEHCTDFELRQLIEDGFRQMVPEGTIIFHEDEPGDSFYIVLAGSVEIFSERAGVHIANRFVGDFFGEMSLLMGMPRIASVRAIEDSVLFVVTHDNLQGLLHNHQELADAISQELVKRQDMLRRLGVLLDEPMDEQNPIVWIRRRMRSIFGI